MFTGKDIRGIEFEEVKRGYNQTDVKAFLRNIADQTDELERSISDLTAQRDALKIEVASSEEKLLLFAGKVEEYRKDEDSLRTALLSAQRLSDTIIKEARENAEIIVNDAKNKAEDILDGISERVVMENEKLKSIHAEVSKFKNDVLSIYKSHLEILSLIPEQTPEAKPSQPEVAPVQEVNEEKTPVEIEEDDTKVYTTAEQLAPEPLQAEPVVVEAPQPIVEEAAPVIDDKFYSPEVAIPNDPFTSFSAGNVTAEVEVQPVIIPEVAIDAAIEPAVESAPEQEKESRFGQLDFGDGFTFKN